MAPSPKLVVYWVDTKKVLDHYERGTLLFHATVLAVTENEVLLEDPVRKRKIMIRSVHEPSVPHPKKS